MLYRAGSGVLGGKPIYICEWELEGVVGLRFCGSGDRRAAPGTSVAGVWMEEAIMLGKGDVVE